MDNDDVPDMKVYGWRIYLEALLSAIVVCDVTYCFQERIVSATKAVGKVMVFSART